MDVNRQPPSEGLLSEMGQLIKRATNWLYKTIPGGAEGADLHARRIVYTMLAQYLVQILPDARDVDERDLMPAIAELLGEPDPSSLHDRPPAEGERSPNAQEIRRLLQGTILQVHVSYKRTRTDADTSSRRFGVECSLITTVAGKVAKTMLARTVTWEEMPNVVTEHFIRSAEEIEMQLYPLEGGE
jgi:hypothetical protein